MKYFAFALLLVTSSAFAHHGWSNYDNTKILKIEGTVDDVAFTNPHATIKLSQDKKEEPVLDVILAPISRMTDRGLPKDKLKKGLKVTIEGYANKKDAKEIRAERIIVDGKSIELR